MEWFGERTSIAATDLAWSKWKPSEPTSPHWYTTAHFERLIGAYIKHDADKGRERQFKVIDLGLRLADIKGLQREQVCAITGVTKKSRG